MIELKSARVNKEITSSELPYPGVSTKQIFLSSTSPLLSLLLMIGRLVLISRSASVFHHCGYARVLALISRIFSVGGMLFDSRVLRRDKDGLINEDDDVDDVAICGGS
jgi:hypothetical protein